MKKYFYLCFFLLFFALTTACKDQNIQAESDIFPETDSSTFSQDGVVIGTDSDDSAYALITYLDRDLFLLLIEEGQNYKVYSDEQLSGFYYEIYDYEGAQLDVGYASWQFAGVDIVNNSLLEVSTNTGGASFYTKYYDVQKGRISRIFPKPAGVSSSLVAYFDTDDKGIKLIVQNIFSVAEYYAEFRDDTFSASVYTAATDAQFNNDDTVLVTYVDKNGNTVTKTFDLR